VAENNLCKEMNSKESFNSWRGKYFDVEWDRVHLAHWLLDLLYLPQMMSVEQSVEWVTGETEVLGEKPAPVPLCPPQSPHDLTSATVAGSQWLTTWAMAQPREKMACDTLWDTK
jgi:hypothetical protein